MARLKRGSIPTLRRHKATGKAVVTLSGQDFYCGTRGTKASLAEYDRHVNEWLTRGRRPALVDLREARVVQEVESGSSSELTLDVRLRQLSAHRKNRCVLVRQLVGSIGRTSSRARVRSGTISGTILGTAGFLQVEASRILRVLVAVRWPRG